MPYKNKDVYREYQKKYAMENPSRDRVRRWRSNNPCNNSVTIQSNKPVVNELRNKIELIQGGGTPNNNLKDSTVTFKEDYRVEPTYD